MGMDPGAEAGPPSPGWVPCWGARGGAGAWWPAGQWGLRGFVQLLL